MKPDTSKSFRYNKKKPEWNKRKLEQLKLGQTPDIKRAVFFNFATNPSQRTGRSAWDKCNHYNTGATPESFYTVRGLDKGGGDGH
ncbi:hypothetical protein GWI33_020214 [Rhynchophorus ferrugineus]|uniref:Uncharacterized protein n=1 Tax=Rhynchophorus ferrugineus TaxID=354439 RepID=A0A834HPV9_RHYFE|nr:hypothetical protein GWI33_020214 [Rhynchophorus ferrugineus]